MNANTRANILFHTNDIVVTPAIARFGAVTYQMSTISSVAIYHRPKLNPIAVTLAMAAIALAAFAFFAREPYPDYSLWSAVAAPVALILAAIWQRIRPVMEYRLVMRAAGSETETVTTFDRAQIFELRQAIEDAFHMPRVHVEHIDTIRTPRVDEHANQDIHITRDWVVANVDLAPR